MLRTIYPSRMDKSDVFVFVFCFVLFCFFWGGGGFLCPLSLSSVSIFGQLLLGPSTDPGPQGTETVCSNSDFTVLVTFQKLRVRLFLAGGYQ